MYRFLAYGITHHAESYSVLENGDISFVPLGKEEEVVLPRGVIDSGYVLIKIVDEEDV